MNQNLNWASESSVIFIDFSKHMQVSLQRKLAGLGGKVSVKTISKDDLRTFLDDYDDENCSCKLFDMMWKSNVLAHMRLT